MKRKEATVSIRASSFGQRKRTSVVEPCTGRACPSTLPRFSSPPFPRSPAITTYNSWPCLDLRKSHQCPQWCSPGSLGRGDLPGAKTVSPACEHLPGGRPAGGRAGEGGGQVEEGGAAARPGRWRVSPGPRPQSRNGGGGIHFCKQSLDGETSLCFSATVRTPSPSELTGAAGVTLQQPDDGGVALGTFDEFFQGQFACGTGERRNGGQPVLCGLCTSRGPGHCSHVRGMPPLA